MIYIYVMFQHITGGCFRVLAANKYKAVKNLADLKEEFKGKKPSTNVQQQLRVAEVCLLWH